MLIYFTVSQVLLLCYISQALHQLCRGYPAHNPDEETDFQRGQKNLANGTDLVGEGALDTSLEIAWCGLAKRRFDN